MIKDSDNLFLLKRKGNDDLSCLQKHGIFSMFNIFAKKISDVYLWVLCTIPRLRIWSSRTEIGKIPFCYKLSKNHLSHAQHFKVTFQSRISAPPSYIFSEKSSDPPPALPRFLIFPRLSLIDFWSAWDKCIIGIHFEINYVYIVESALSYLVAAKGHTYWIKSKANSGWCG